MAENQLLGALRRYEFYSNISNFLSELFATVTQDLYGDIHWEWNYYNNNEYAIPKCWNYPSSTGGNQGTITAKNVKDPSMFFTICLNISRWWYNSSYGPWYLNYVLRTGLRNNGATVVPDLYTNVGDVSEIPVHTVPQSLEYNMGNKQVNPYYKWTLFTTEEYIFIYGEPQTLTDRAYPVRLYLGRLKPFEEEDPIVANDFVGIFGHYPPGLIDTDDELRYRTGRGYVRSSAMELQTHCITSQQALRFSLLGLVVGSSYLRSTYGTEQKAYVVNSSESERLF
ncbi:hypothetical protein RE628_17635 [Paenibacillus sp. D2_2]|uniref:hypothetical protein n=1 Tax=Paenibacillus sp. D2_2 TaxID=3073092 RepID=UPI0028151377|nr:hypothetical protein [Paenibacillus sp. D2_2]WMT39274.1 hypothetical protein RE628_17635 [Paenibacillus sp. D2_2]